MQVVQHGPHSPAPRAVSRVTIKDVFADIEVERREVGRAEGVQLGVDAGPVMGSQGRTEAGVELGQPVQHPAFELGQSGLGQTLAVVEAVEATEQPTQGVAQPAVELGLLLEDLRPDPEVFVDVRVHGPQAQDVGAHLLGDFLRRGDVAERLAHLASVLVQHEAVGQYGFIRRAAAGPDGLEQAGLEPAPVLVAALEVEVGGPAIADCLHGKAVRAAALEPDVDNVHYLLEFVRIAIRPQEAARRAAVPGIGAFALEGADDALEHGRVAQGLAGAALDEDGDGHTPGALAADAPVGAAGDHAGQAGAAGFGDEAGLGDGGERLGADGALAVERDEPLRGGAVDDRGLGAPAVRIAVQQRAAREQAAGRLDGVGDRLGRFEHVGAGEKRHP